VDPGARTGAVDDVIGARVAGEDVHVLRLSRDDMVVEGPLRLNPDTEATVDIVRSGGATRMRCRVLRCAVKTLSAKGPRYELTVAFPAPLEAPRPVRAQTGFDVAGVEFGDPDPAFDANRW
jgi:hypothetical protein